MLIWLVAKTSIAGFLSRREFEMRRLMVKSCLSLMSVALCLSLSTLLLAEEKFEARLLTELETGGELAMKFEILIESYTSAEEVSQLKEAFSKGGYESFMSAFRGMNKGILSPVSGRGVKIIIHAAHNLPTEKGRKILLFTPNQSWDADTARIIDWRFPFMLIELDISHKGKGRGKIYEQVSITLTREGTVGMDLYNSPPLALWGVRALAERKPDVRKEDTGKFRGIGLSLKLSGGGSFFDCGDLERGSQGEFEARAEDIAAQGFTIDEKRAESLNSGLEIAADLTFMVMSRVGVSLGVGAGKADVENLLVFYESPGVLSNLNSQPNLHTLHVRLGISYWPLLGRLVSFYVQGGVGLYLADYKLNLTLSMRNEGEGFTQSAKGKGFGVHGGGGFELALNPKVSLFVEAQGCYARLNGFEGSEVQELYQRQELYPGTQGYKINGALYYFENEPQPRLAILEGEQAGARQAVLDLRNLSIRAGLRFKF